MEDPEVSYRIRFIEVLGYLRERSIVPRLIQLLGDSDATIRSFAIQALACIGDPRAVPALEQVAQHDPATTPQGEFYLRTAAGKAIEKIRAADSPGAVTPESKAKADFTPGPNEVSLKSFQNARYFWQQAEIGKKLIEQGDKSLIPELVKMLNAENRQVRCNVGMVLAGLGDERGLKAVITELQDREPRPTKMRRSDGRPWIEGQIGEDRCYAAHVLGDIRDQRSLPALLSVLTEPSINLAAAWSLGEIADRQALPALREMLGRAGADPMEKLCAAHAMAKIGDSAGVSALVELLKSPHWVDRRNTAKALGELRDRRAVTGLIESLQDASPDVQVASAWALGQIGDPVALPALRDLLTNDTTNTSGPPRKLRDVAAEAIDQIRAANPPGAPDPQPQTKEDANTAIRVRTAVQSREVPADDQAAQVLLEFQVVKVSDELRPDRETLIQMANLLGLVLHMRRPNQQDSDLDLTLGEFLKRYVVPQPLSAETGEAIVNLLQSRGYLEVSAKPQVLTRDGSPAEVRVITGERFLRSA